MITSIQPAAQSCPILKILQNQVVPWIGEFGMERVVIARPAMKDVVLPPGAEISRKKRRGQRISVRGAQEGDSPRVVSALWPEDQQIEVRTPQLMCVVEGQTDIHFSDYVLHCPQKYFIFIPPGVAKPTGTSEPHLEGKNRLHGSCDILWFSLHRRWMQMWLCHSLGTQHIGPQFHENVITIDSYPAHLLEALWEGLTTYHPRYHKLYHALLQSLMLSLQRNLLEERFLYVTSDIPRESPYASNSKLGYDPMSHAREYIENHLHENLTLENVAHKVYMSRAQFAKRFHAQTGQTFVTYITNRRLEQAQHLLRETDFTLAYISRMVGYKSAPHLHNLFKRHYQVAPLQFRRQVRQTAKIPDDNKGQ